MFLPEKIKSLIVDEKLETDTVGMSEASVLVGENKVLKVQDYTEEAENEYRMLRFLQGGFRFLCLMPMRWRTANRIC